jgi:hypothetical protein
MTYEVKITTIDKNLTYVVKAENVLEAEAEAIKKLGKDIPKDYVTAGQFNVEHIEHIPDA